MKRLLFLFLLISSWAYGQQDWDALLQKYNEDAVPYITATQTATALASGKKVVVLDAREADEYRTSHLPNAIFVGYDDFNLSKEAEKSLKEADQIIVYCTVGVRSEDIGALLLQKGYTNVQNLKGGILSWKNNEFEVYDMDQQPTEEVHVYGPSWGKYLIKGTAVHD